MSCTRTFTCRQISRLALCTWRRSSSSSGGRCGRLWADSPSAQIRERLCRGQPAPLAAQQLPRPARTSCRRWVWNASYLDEDDAKDLEGRIRDQLRSLDRIREEIAATCSTTQRDELERLTSQQRQREYQLGHLLAQYKKVSGEDYHVDPNVVAEAGPSAKR